MKKGNTQSFKLFFILTAILSFFIINTSNAFAEFYVIAGSRGVGTEIKSLPYTISSPGFYYITKDFTCLTSTHGITINADNVTLDLMGFSLIYDGGAGDHDGIYMHGRSNVEIRNGTVRFFSRHGICENGVDEGEGHRIINVRAKDNTQYGINLSGKCHLIERCTAEGNDSCGISTGPGSTVTGNTSYCNTGTGIFAATGSTIKDNTCYDNTGTGISASTCTSVIANTCYSNTGYGINLGGYNAVDQNTSRGNTLGNMTDCANCEFGTNIGEPSP